MGDRANPAPALARTMPGSRTVIHRGQALPASGRFPIDPHHLPARGNTLFFNPFAAGVFPLEQDKRYNRLRDLDMWMHGFLAAKQGRASATVIQTVASARDHVRHELEKCTPSRPAVQVLRKRSERTRT